MASSRVLWVPGRLRHRNPRFYTSLTAASLNSRLNFRRPTRGVVLISTSFAELRRSSIVAIDFRPDFDYRDTLQSHSGPLMPFIEWKATSDGNVEVTNDTADLYRYFDCTAEAEFLYACVERTVGHDLPQEIDYLKRQDAALQRIMNAVEMPDRLAQNLIMFTRQNDGVLPRRRRENEFAKLTDAEVADIEKIVAEEFDGYEGGAR
ncbi:MAG: hypothetical protein P4M09_17470 [Devosia sp.]|nr:hypothetical protein [Devosia sp.]